MIMTQGSMRQEESFRTSDMALTAVLLLSHPLEEVDRQNPRKAQFVFRRNDDLDRVVDSFWKGLLQVEPQSFFNQLRLVKARLYGEE